MPTTATSPDEIVALIKASIGQTVHVETPGGVDYPDGYRSRDHHAIHILSDYAVGPDNRMYAYFRTLPGRSRWTAYYAIASMTGVEVS
ncbi:hypothetical protein [Nonomuraea sp. NPDC023979]|uniref:hypothetical protein n=1 Tax=Nonomuraea sp. NPDC023979 TaxID=3154796 RepID=UPI0033D5E2B9